MGEDICKPPIQKGVNIQNIQKLLQRNINKTKTQFKIWERT